MSEECAVSGEINLFPFFTFSFVLEFVASPMDGVSLLLDVLRAIQLSQNTITGSSTLNSQQNLELRNNQTYQRRALLDELTCL